MNGNRDFVVRLLAKYWTANPLACDTPDGICRWWLSSDRVGMDSLLAALAWMKERGLVDELTAADGRTRYRRSASDDRLSDVVRDGEAYPAGKH